MTLTILPLSEPYQKVSYRSAGTGEPIVLLHGVGMQSAAWEPQFEALAKHHQVFALDLPGHGETPPLPIGAVLEDFVEWLKAVVKTLNLGPFNLAGHSMGSLIALGYCIQESGAVLRLALLNSVFCRTQPARQAVVARADEIANGGTIDLTSSLNRWFCGGENQLAVRNNVAKWLGDVSRDGYASTYRAFAMGDRTFADRVSQITCPTLALTGDGDPNSTPNMSEELAGLVADGEAVIVDGHRHMVNLTAPDAVNLALANWLAKPVRSSAVKCKN